MELSIIIPTLDEEACLGATLDALPRSDDTEILVVDGGSRDATPRIACSHGVQLLTARRGRAHQMNHGATGARGKWLMFLHADTRPAAEAIPMLRRTIRRNSVCHGAFRLRVAGSARDPFFRCLEFVVDLRTRCLGLPYGDQAIFVRHDVFESIGGFREDSPGEDLDLILRLRGKGRLERLTASVETSSRRWKRHGRLRTTVQHARVAGQCLWRALREGT